MVMFAGSYFSILLTLTVVQISAVGGKKKHKKATNVRISQEKRKSLNTLFMYLAP